MTPPPPPESWAAFAVANDAAAATTKKLEKQAVLAAYLSALAGDEDVRRAVRYAGGKTFGSTDERVTGVSGATMADVAAPLLGVGPGAYKAAVVAHGEVGEALAALWPQGRPPPAEPLVLADVAEAFDALAETGQFEAKRAILRELLARATSPREAAYLGKVIFGDLRTGVREGVLQGAVAEAFGRDFDAVRRAHLLVGDLDEVAVLAHHDRLADAAFRLFHPIQFMLASPLETTGEAAARLEDRRQRTEDRPEVGGAASPQVRPVFCPPSTVFLAEDKLDGVRAQVHKSGDRLAIYTRTLDRADASYPDVTGALAGVPGDWLLDGEIVPFRAGRVLPFVNMQRRLGRKDLTPKVLRDHPLVFVAFDCLYRDGVLLMDAPLIDRRAVLLDLAEKAGAPGLTDARPGPFRVGRAVEVADEPQIAAAFDAARTARNEGLILKDPQSVYAPGRRGLAWFKLKTHLPTLDCVVTAAEHGHGKRRNHLSDYTFAVWDRPPEEDAAALVNIGKAFSGVTDAEIEELTETFLSLQTGKFGRVYTVRPQVVLEIACDQIQRSGRHAGGFALRFPRIKRIRRDKRPEDADTLARVAEVYGSEDNFGKVEEVREEREPSLFD